jgi:hypothetical protein
MGLSNDATCGNVNRRRDFLTTYFVTAQLWTGMK